MHVIARIEVDPHLGPPPPTPLCPDPEFRHDDEGAWWPGVMHAWRWTGPDQEEWTALVTFTRPRLGTYCQWVQGQYLRRVGHGDDNLDT